MKHTPTREIADRISKHLARFERDPRINRFVSHGGMKTTHYYLANAVCVRGPKPVSICYIGYHPRASVTRAVAEAYLADLDAGYEGTHYGAPRVMALKTKP